MKKNVEQPNIESLEKLETSQEVVQELVAQEEELPLEDKAEEFLEEQDKEIQEEETKHKPKTLSGLKKWAASITLMGSSLLAVGCNAEKPSVENVDGQKIESNKDGFKDDVRENVRQRLRIKKAEIKHMKEVERQK